jgi:hypothetical protein
MLKKTKIKLGLWILDGMMTPGSNARKTLVFWKVGKLLQEGKNMETLAKLKELVQGKKTYILAIGAIVGTIVAWTNGQVNDVDAIKQIWEALIAATIRQGISKV